MIRDLAAAPETAGEVLIDLLHLVPLYGVERVRAEQLADLVV
jgi:hypothetical protein